MVLVINALVGERGLMETLRARKHHQELKVAIDRLRTENVRLRDEARRLRSDPAMIEALARQELGLIKPGEVLFIIKDARCVLPQLLLLRQTTVPTVIDSFYLLALGSYRAFYCVNWLIRGLDSSDPGPDKVSVIFGIIQTALYVDFAWVYYTRQRVKLRGGGIVDADDLRRSWFLRRIFGKHAQVADEDDEESGPALGGDENGGRRSNRPKWGARGISISADDGVFDAEREHLAQSEGVTSPVDPDAKMRDPDELAKALDDDDDDDRLNERNGSPSGVRNDEWRD
jgi:hypothetical protein